MMTEYGLLIQDLGFVINRGFLTKIKERQDLNRRVNSHYQECIRPLFFRIASYYGVVMPECRVPVNIHHFNEVARIRLCQSYYDHLNDQIKELQCLRAQIKELPVSKSNKRFL